MQKIYLVFLVEKDRPRKELTYVDFAFDAAFPNIRQAIDYIDDDLRLNLKDDDFWVKEEYINTHRERHLWDSEWFFGDLGVMVQSYTMQVDDSVGTVTFQDQKS